MVLQNHHWVVEMLNSRQECLATEPIQVDWEPVEEHMRLYIQRRARQPVCVSGRQVAIEPRPHPTTGSPYVAGFRAVWTPTEGNPVTCEFPLTYFHEAVQGVAARLVRESKLESAETCRYRVAAYPGFTGRAADLPFKVTPVAEPMPLAPGSLGSLEQRSIPFGIGHKEDLPVFISQEVLEEAGVLTLRAGPCETGGLLLGHLVQDSARGELAVVVAAQIPAKHTDAALAQITFTPDTWSAARDALALRHRGETMLGFWHTHPTRYFCQECPEENRRTCPLRRDFFSADDRHFFKTVFPKAFQTALVISNTEEGLQQALYGWRTGMIQSRSFHILNAVPSAGNPPQAATLPN